MTALLLAVVSAWAAEYRRIELADGRIVTGQVVADTADGITLSIPQGLADVAYSDVVRIDNVDPAVAAAVPPLRLLVLPTTGSADASTVDRQLRAALSAVPATSVLSLDTLPPTVSDATRAALRGCGLDASCVVSAATDVPADVVVMPQVSAQPTVEEVRLASVWLDAPQAQAHVTTAHPTNVRARADDLGGAAFTLLRVRPADAAAQAAAGQLAFAAVAPTTSPTSTPAPLAPVARPTPPRVAVTRAPRGDTTWQSFVPVPGFTAFMNGKPGLGAAAVAVVVPSTAAVTWAAGVGSARASTMIGLSVVGYYTFCVVSNRIVGPVLVAPTPGGAALVTGGTF